MRAVLFFAVRMPMDLLSGDDEACLLSCRSSLPQHRSASLSPPHCSQRATAPVGAAELQLLQNIVYQDATLSAPLHRPPRTYPQGSPCDAPARYNLRNPGKFHGSLSLSFHRALTPRQRADHLRHTQAVAAATTTDLVVHCFSLKKPPSIHRSSLMMEHPENAVVHPVGWGRATPTRIRCCHILSSGGDCTALHGGTWPDAPPPSSKQSTPGRHILGWAFARAFVSARWTVTEKECMEQDLGVGSLGRTGMGQNASWSPPLNREKC